MYNAQHQADQVLTSAALAQSRPSYLGVIPENIPSILKAVSNWVTWRAEQRHGRWTKRLTTAAGYAASSTDPKTWTTFERAIAAYDRGGFDGVGWVLDGEPATSDGLVIAGVDLDHVTENEARRERAQRLIAAFRSYAEWSPSGTGVHIYCLADPLQRGLNRDGVELYTSKRFLTVTGHRLVAADV